MDNHDHSLWGAIPTIVGIAVLAILGLSALFWVAGAVFHLIGWGVHAVVVVAIAFFLCRFFTRRLYRTRL